MRRRRAAKPSVSHSQRSAAEVSSRGAVSRDGSEALVKRLIHPNHSKEGRTVVALEQHGLLVLEGVGDGGHEVLESRAWWAAA